MKLRFTLLAACIIGCLAFTGIPTVPKTTHAAVEAIASDVYICTGSYATKYHSTSSCRGLNNCKGSIKKISQKEAASKGRSACSICYR